MSGNVLRRAAALMRERAEAATPGPWDSWGTSLVRDTGVCGGGGCGAPYGHEPGCSLDHLGDASEPDAAHIASWHPAVALAVADWLDKEAAEFDRLAAQAFAVNLLLATADGDPIDARISLGYHTLNQALAVARAYLGEAS